MGVDQLRHLLALLGPDVKLHEHRLDIFEFARLRGAIELFEHRLGLIEAPHGQQRLDLDHLGQPRIGDGFKHPPHQAGVVPHQRAVVVVEVQQPGVDRFVGWLCVESVEQHALGVGIAVKLPQEVRFGKHQRVCRRGITQQLIDQSQRFAVPPAADQSFNANLIDPRVIRVGESIQQRLGFFVVAGL